MILKVLLIVNFGIDTVIKQELIQYGENISKLGNRNKESLAAHRTEQSKLPMDKFIWHRKCDS